MFQDDGWEVDARIGILTSASDVGSESEMRAIAPCNVGLHVARISTSAGTFSVGPQASAPWEGTKLDDLAITHMPAAHLAAAPIAAIGVCSTCFSYRIGRSDESRILSGISRRTRGLPVVSSSAALVQALTSFEASDIAVVNPPWFTREMIERGAEYFKAAGFSVKFNAAADVASNQHLVTRADLFRWIISNVPAGVEAIAIVGNNLRAVGVVGDLEAEMARPVFTANQVLLWALMSLAGVDPQGVQGYGVVFRLRYAATE